MGKKKNDKTLSTGKKLLFILLLSCSLTGLGVFAGFAFQNLYSLLFAAPSGILAFVMLLILLKDYKPAKKEKTAKWYVDKYLAALVPAWVICAIVLIAVGSGENDIVMAAGFLMFPVMSILIAPNAALYAVRDMKGWERIFYGNGNLENFKQNKDFYPVKVPVAFEKKLFLAVIKDQILNILTAVSLMFIAAVFGLISILTYVSHSASPGDLIDAILYVRLRRETGVMAFLLLLVVVFGFPVFVYYITNAIYKLRIVSGHKYMAYHAVVGSIDSGTMRIDCDGRHYKYKYCTPVGMKPKQVKNTPAVLIFIPYDVFIFPDSAIDS